MKKKVCITGVAGFLGSHLADKFYQEGWAVSGIDNLIGGYLLNVPNFVDFIEGDCCDLRVMQEVTTDCELIIHAACTAYEGLSVFSPALVVKNTVQATVTALSASVQSGVKKFVYCSSMARYGTQEVVPFTEDLETYPQDPYGIAKVASENLVKNIASTHGLEWTVLVPHNIIGPRQKFDDPYRNVASIMINRMLQGKQPIIYGDGEQKRCFSFVSDVVDPLFQAATNDSANSKVINVGPDDEYITINHLAKTIARLLDVDLNPLYVPARPNEVRNANCSSHLARTILNFNSKTSLEDGLKELVSWVKLFGPKEFSYHLPLEIINEQTPATWREQLI
jgi:UDP-glucose 4-epimerase